MKTYGTLRLHSIFSPSQYMSEIMPQVPEGPKGANNSQPDTSNEKNDIMIGDIRISPSANAAIKAFGLLIQPRLNYDLKPILEVNGNKRYYVSVISSLDNRQQYMGKVPVQFDSGTRRIDLISSDWWQIVLSGKNKDGSIDILIISKQPPKKWNIQQPKSEENPNIPLQWPEGGQATPPQGQVRNPNDSPKWPETNNGEQTSDIILESWQQIQLTTDWNGTPLYITLNWKKHGVVGEVIMAWADMYSTYNIDWVKYILYQPGLHNWKPTLLPENYNRSLSK